MNAYQNEQAAARIFHRHGGEITAVHAITHETYKGVASWAFECDVRWSDGSESRAVLVEPIALAHDGTDESKAAVNNLLSQLNEYLADAGEWHDAKFKRDGRAYSWTPKKPKGRLEVQS